VIVRRDAQADFGRRTEAEIGSIPTSWMFVIRIAGAPEFAHVVVRVPAELALPSRRRSEAVAVPRQQKMQGIKRPASFTCQQAGPTSPARKPRLVVGRVRRGFVMPCDEKSSTASCRRDQVTWRVARLRFPRLHGAPADRAARSRHPPGLGARQTRQCLTRAPGHREAAPGPILGELRGRFGGTVGRSAHLSQLSCGDNFLARVSCRVKWLAANSRRRLQLQPLKYASLHREESLRFGAASLDA